MSTHDHERHTNWLHDPANISVGQARIPWAPPCHPHLGDLLPHGWVLPGGSRTLDRGLAEIVAQRINQIIGRG